MGTCIICGTETDGAVCATHEEDVAFVFEGTSPNHLTPNRYYRGTVDGYADFGVFVDVGESVTGLLHQSEIDQRLESLHWEPGDEVFVQVDGVRDNGNVDLSWSIRQSPDEFRGLLVDAPEGDRVPEEESDEGDQGDANAGTAGHDDTTVDEDTRAGDSTGRDQAVDHDENGRDDSSDTENDAAAASGQVQQRQSDGGTATHTVETTVDTQETDVDETAQEPSVGAAAVDETSTADAGPAAGEESAAGDEPATDAEDDEPTPADVGELTERVDERVRLEGEVVDCYQTSGPTVFHLRDATGSVDCAAFDGAGIRAYPEVDVGDYVRLDGVVERRHGDLQVETETLLVLTGEERETVASDIEAAIEESVRPESVRFLAEDDPAEPLADGLREAATAVRRAIAADRPVVIRHPATADGYAAGAAIERGAMQRARDVGDGAEPDYHAVHRRPLDDRVYGMDAVTSDVTRMLQDRERHGEQLPLLVLAGLGSSTEAVEAVDLLDLYDVDRLVLDVARPDEGAETVGDPVVNPHLEGVEERLSIAALGSALGATVAESVAEEVAHVPAIGYWESTPAAYEAAADDAGVDADERRAIREALALEAHYQSYNDKRELVADILFEGAPGLAEHVAEQFRIKLDTEHDTARENLVVRETDGVRFGVLDTDAFTHRFDFPPTELLLDELHREEREAAEGAVVTIGAGEERLSVRSTEPVDVREIAASASESVAGVSAVGGRDGRIEYLPGVREAAIEAVIGAVADSIDG